MNEDKNIPYFGEPAQVSGYSFAESPQADVVRYDSGTEFSQAIAGMRTDDVLAVVDDLVNTLQIVNPRLYAGVMRKFEEEGR